MMFNKESKFEEFESKLYLSNSSMHGKEFEYIKETYDTNWMFTDGENINEVERLACECRCV